VLPLQFPQGITRKTLRLDGSESINLRGLKAIAAGMTVRMEITDTGGNSRSCDLICRLDTALEVAYFTNGGIMPYVVRQLTAK